MSYQVIARKWRPQAFEQVTGQEHITQTLRNAIEHGRLHHAYLFSGARGVGKTTTARLLAKALNCHKTDTANVMPCAGDDPAACASCLEIGQSRSIDVIEFDAASHTKVEEIRDVILQSISVAAARDRNKIFIIDEVHMLSTSSFNALLKTLEEPPPNVVFIMATTEPHKVPDTILSRCQEFEFRTIALTKIAERLKLIADAEKIDITDEAIRELARSGEGSMRDAQSNFDQVISFSDGKIGAADVANALGLASTEMLKKIVSAIAEKEPKTALLVVDDLIARGHDLRNFSRDLLAVFRDLLVHKIAGGGGGLLEGSILQPEELAKFADPFSESDLLRFFNSLSETESKLRDATRSRYVLEVGLVKLVEMRRLAPIEAILESLAKFGGTENGSAASASAEPAETTRAASVKSAAEEKKTLKTPEPVFPEAPAAPEPPPEPPQTYPEDRPEEIYNPPAEERPRIDLSFVDKIAFRLPEIAAEELEHHEDSWLDNVYEQKLEQSGDDLAPIAAAHDLVAQLLGSKLRPETGTDAPNANGTATAPAYARPDIIPVIEDTAEAPTMTLSADPTDRELLEYAQGHPKVRLAMRVFHGKVVGAKKI